ncbi:MAG: DUF2283 domain-containing protein [Nanoarchaeota archaeon]
MQKFNFSYDKEYDDLFLYSQASKSKGSVELGSLILDYNRKKELVGIQIMDASAFLHELINEKKEVIRDLLKNLIACKAEIKTKNNLLIIKMSLFSKTRELSPVISVPVISESSPSLASA